MPFRVFQYPIPMDPELPDLNGFLASQRVAIVERHVIVASAGPMLIFVVETAGQAKAASAGQTSQKVDYREKLSKEDFIVFSSLRRKREEIAEAEGLPLYAIFSNAHLGAMAEERTPSLEAMLKIPGISKSRVEKFGAQFLEILLANQRAPNGPKA